MVSVGDASYLLVATLPGEVEQAGGEQLILGAGTAVHGARLFQPTGVCGVVSSHVVLSGSV